MTSNLALVDGSFSGVIVNVYTSNGERSPQNSFYDGVLGSSDKIRTQDELVRSYWILLRPGSFYGKTSDLLHVPATPGKYKLVATYFDSTINYLSESEKENLKTLPYPILGTQLSNPVIITILPRTR